MRVTRGRLCLALLGCCLAAAGAAAQTARPQPPGLRATADLYGGYDAPLFANTSTTAFNPTSQGFGGGDVNLSYFRPGRRVSVVGSVLAANRYYPGFTPSTAPSYGASFGFNSMSLGRWSWSLAQNALYAPLSAATLFAAGSGGAQQFQNLGATALVGATNFQISTIRQVDLNTGANLAYAITRRTSVALLGAVGTQLQIDSTLPNALRYDGRIRLSRSITRTLRAFAGYGLSAVQVPAQGAVPGSTLTIDGYDFGIDFSKPFQVTRNTTFSIQTGLVKVPNVGRSEFQFIGAATLDYRVRRTWNAQLAATRDARFVQAYRNPVVFAGVSASVGGPLTTHLGTSLSANYSSGNINVAPTPVAFDSASASARLRYDVRRTTGLFVEYTLFRSSFDVSSAAAGYPTGAFGRHGVRAGLSLGVSPFSRRP